VTESKLSEKKATLLIVDDTPDNLALLSDLLRDDYKLKIATSGEKALRIAASDAPPDLILLDVIMPGMDGYQVASRLKADSATANIPIIMVTAHLDQGARVAGLKAGAEDFLTKPVDATELSLRVRNLLRLKTLGDLLRNYNQTLEREVQARVADLQAFRSAMDATAEGIVLVKRSSMRFVEVNATACKLFGYARDQLLELGPAGLASVTEEQLRCSYDAIIAGNDANTLTELQLMRKDGSRFQAEVRRHALRSGADWLIVGVVRDITERKAAEEETRRHLEQIKAAFMSTVEVATNISEMRDPYTAGHERRVAEIAVGIGAEFGFDAHRQEGLRVAGLLHDIGKITIPSQILSKPGNLSKTEFKLIKEHAQASYNALKGVKFPWPVAEAALQHHERADGSGYPHGLKGEAILLEARILAVSDVVEAMASHRPYRAALGIEAALAEIERGRGTAYDPLVADACLRLFRQKQFRLTA
jgi:PAS domain S-box-containing protein